jgi:hypothetical protein
MRGDPDADAIQHRVGDLVTKRAERLVPTVLAWEEPWLVRTAQQRR